MVALCQPDRPAAPGDVTVKHVRGHMNIALEAGARARVNVTAIPSTWYFATKTNGERPKGAPPS